MGLKESLKNNSILRRAVKKAKIYFEFLSDAKDFSSSYLEIAEREGDFRFKVLLLTHSLEKGMCMPNLRPFGHQKALQLKTILERIGCENGMEFEYNLGASVLAAWVSFFNDNEWAKDSTVKDIESFLVDKTFSYQAGRKKYKNPHRVLQSGLFTDIMLSRHSVRDFEDRELDKEDIEYALKMFVEAPTACNRQMCKVLLVKNPSVIELLNKTILGVGGFNKSTMNYFIITYDISAFDFFGERNQGYLNAGLAAMNFTNGLHARGIGSCFMQWANKRSEDIIVRKALGLKKSEKIAIVLGAGYYKEESYIPCSCRRDISDVFSVVE